MKDQTKTNQQLLEENSFLKQRIKELEQAESDRKHVEETLRQSEQRYRQLESDYKSIVENTSEGVYRSTPGGRYVIANRAFARMLGYDSPEEVLCSVTNISTQIYVDSERRMNSMESTLKAGHDDIEVQFKRKDGSIGWLMNSVRVVRNEQGEIKYFEGITKDITDRKRTEEKLNNHMEFITTLINTIPSPVFYKDVAGKYLGCNRAFEEFFGKSRSFILGKTTYDIAPAAIANEYREKDLELFGHHGTQTYEGKVAAPDGSIRDVLISKATYTDTSKNVAGLIGVLIDITDRKRAAEALDEERRQLKQALDEIRTLRGIVPICANCKKIRDDKGYWNHVEKYISEHTGAKFSHGICPDCVKELYPEFYEEKQADDKL